MRKDKKFVTKVDEQNLKVNKETGELTEIYLRKVIETQEEFLKIYINSLDELVKLNNRELQILFIILKRSKYCEEKNKDGNIFYNEHLFKEEVKAVVDKDLKDNIINQYVSSLAKNKLIIRVKRGTFILNPIFFAKGKLTIDTRLHLVMSYLGKV